MSTWVKQYPVAFTTGGDKTYQAIEKHMNELSRMYTFLNRLRTMDSDATAPSDPAEGALWMDDSAATPRIKRFDGSSWRSVMDDTPAEGVVPIAGANGRIDPGFTFPPGTILPFAAGSTPAGFLACNGSTVSRTAYAGLFSVIGTAYGPGDGSTTFTLPDLRARIPVGHGSQGGLTSRTIGATGGEESHLLTEAEMPVHDHDLTLKNEVASGGSFPHVSTAITGTYTNTTNTAGGSAPHNTMPPYLAINFVIKT